MYYGLLVFDTIACNTFLTQLVLKYYVALMLCGMMFLPLSVVFALASSCHYSFQHISMF